MSRASLSDDDAVRLHRALLAAKPDATEADWMLLQTAHLAHHLERVAMDAAMRGEYGVYATADGRLRFTTPKEKK